MRETMKEVVVTAPHKVEIREAPIPVPKDDEVLIRMKSAGVCGSDHHIYHGTNPCSTYPRIPGHENAGIVERVGKNVKNVKQGDHVIVDLIHTCGECYQCKIGRKNVCSHVAVRGSGADGENFLPHRQTKFTKFRKAFHGRMRHWLNHMQSVHIVQQEEE